MIISIRDAPLHNNPSRKQLKQFNGKLTKRGESLLKTPSKKVNHVETPNRATMPTLAVNHNIGFEVGQQVKVLRDCT